MFEHPLRLTALLALTSALVACGAPRDSTADSPRAAEQTRAVAESRRSPDPDSCARFDTLARLQKRVLGPDDTIPAPRAGSWSDTRRVALDSFSIEIPSVAEAGARDRAGSYWITKFPGCRYHCALEIHVEPDTARAGLDSYVERLRTPDTTSNSDASDWLPGDPGPATVGGRRALLMELPCGDCTAALLVSDVGGRIVRIEASIDDRDGYQPGLMCRLTRAAASFRWTVD